MVYNIEYKREYRKKWLALGKCPTHIDIDVISGQTRCFKCRNRRRTYSKQRRFRLLDNKKCPNHPNRDVVPEKTLCQECLTYAINRNKKYKLSGMCVSHPNKPVVFGKSKCQECMWKQVLKQANLTNEQATEMLEKQHYICALSTIKLVKGINASPDHIVHKCNGGTDNIKNFRFVDKDINKMRNKYTDEYFKKLCRSVIDKID